MTTRRIIAEFFAMLFVVVVIFMLVRPGSPAADAVKGLSEALTALVKLAVSG